SLRDFLCEACPYCEGKGVIKSKETIILEIYKELLKEVPKRRWGKVVVYVHPDIAELLYDDEREIIEDIEQRFKKKVVVKAMSMLHHEQFKLA
ncbi:MAG: Rne/Rng family ribonuclease, partial [Thermodesulfobacteriota bacterium]